MAQKAKKSEQKTGVILTMTGSSFKFRAITGYFYVPPSDFGQYIIKSGVDDRLTTVLHTLEMSSQPYLDEFSLEEGRKRLGKLMATWTYISSFKQRLLK